MDLPRDWNGPTYDRVAAPLEALGEEVLDRLALHGDETVLDAGCGSGRVTALLLDRLPRGRVVGVDGSPSMIEAARRRLGDRAELRVADLAGLVVAEPVDAILSTATFHWIADHEALFLRLRAALRPGGRLVAQCGGAGNIAQARAAVDEVGAREPFAAHLGSWPGPWNFSTPGDAERHLHAAGFAEVRAWLVHRPVTPEDPASYLRTVVLGDHLARLPAELHDPCVAAILAALGRRPTLGYVRLNLDATG